MAKYTAFDRCVTDKPRRHEFPNPDTGKVDIVSFSSPTVGVEVSLHVARRLATLAPDFEVFDAKGVKLEVASGEGVIVQGIELKPGQVVADLEELAGPALQKRCNALPGGEKFKGNAARKDMIEFLTFASGDAPTKPDADGDDLVEMDEDDEKLGGGDPADAR